jgi:dTMP kinase
VLRGSVVVDAGDNGSVRLSRGLLVAFEGIDGAGKTTQAQLLARRLRDVGLPVTATKEPTSGPYGQRLRASATSGRLEREDELQTFIDDRRDHVERVIGPALAASRVVIVDRYYFSTAAYQGARNFDPDAIIAVNEGFAPKPDLLVLLDIPVDEALRRIDRRQNGNRNGNHFEKRTTLQKCAAIFAQLSRPDLLRIDGTAGIVAIHERIIEALVAGPLSRAMSLGDHPRLGSLRPSARVSAAEVDAIAGDSSLSLEQRLDRLLQVIRG